MGRRRKGRPLNGWLVIDKDGGMTSAQVVSKVRSVTQAAKAGHAGTLDPMATGVLPIALGEATKSMPYVLHGDKSYEFTGRWGEARDTDDIDGVIVDTSPVRPTPEQINLALQQFVGEIQQVPPAYSAVKVQGRRAYDLARQGEVPELQARTVVVDRFELIDCANEDEARFVVDCGTGTYVRALIKDLAVTLKTVGCVSSLRRTRSGPFTEGDAISVDKLAELWQSAPPDEILLPVETALVDIPALALTGPQADRLRNGQAIRVIGIENGTVCATHEGRPVAIAHVEAEDVQPVRVFNL